MEVPAVSMIQSAPAPHFLAMSYDEQPAVLTIFPCRAKDDVTESHAMTHFSVHTAPAYEREAVSS